MVNFRGKKKKVKPASIKRKMRCTNENNDRMEIKSIERED